MIVQWVLLPPGHHASAPFVSYAQATLENTTFETAQEIQNPEKSSPSTSHKRTT
jgi:hypothetical protein